MYKAGLAFKLPQLFEPFWEAGLAKQLDDFRAGTRCAFTVYERGSEAMIGYLNFSEIVRGV